jgi:ADP-heptose:LPS heptosyltransferase
MPRATNRVRALAGALTNVLARRRPYSRPGRPRKILVLHELLLGDTLMLAPLLAALRRNYPEAEVFITSSPGYAGLFSGKPYGAKVLPYSERQANALAELAPASGCDIALLPGDNRLAITARALGAKWIVGFAGGRPAWRNGAVDEFLDMPAVPMALADMFALLSGLGRPEIDQLCYVKGDWPAPDFKPFEIPSAPYAVLHVGAGSPLRLWDLKNWRAVAEELSHRGIRVTWTAAKHETGLVDAIDPTGAFQSFAGQLDLAQLWHLLVGARMAITLDTGIAHMAKLTGTPVATLFGPGSAQLFGKGRFWSRSEFDEITAQRFTCRDQRHLFKREIEWVRRCNRKVPECPRARCMEAIAPEQVIAALSRIAPC